MLDNTRPTRLNQSGLTLVELLISMSIASLILVALFSISVYVYGSAVRTTIQARLSGEAQAILRSVVEELRQSSSIRPNNANPDDNAPGGAWTTSNSNLILIISTPVLDSSNNFVIDPDTGYPYQNEIVYFASADRLYKRFLVDPDAAGNTRQTTCPQAISSSACPPDILMSDNFSDLSFILYDQDDATTTNTAAARSIKLLIQMERKSYGKLVRFDNTIRITIRNSAS